MLLLPPHVGGMVEPPPLTGLIELVGEEEPPAKLSVAVSPHAPARRQNGFGPYREVWELIGVHRLSVGPLDGDTGTEELIPAYQLVGMALV